MTMMITMMLMIYDNADDADGADCADDLENPTFFGGDHLYL